MSFSESLTVRILGDSSELQRELDSVLNRFDELKRKISETSNASRQFSNSFRSVSQAVGPLQQVGNLISRISQQLQTISQRPLTLNVGPAMAALQRLTQAAQQTAAAIRAIPPIPVAGPAIGPGPIPIGNVIPPRRLAVGGLVTGRSGIDRVPAQLTAGEYVINRSSVERLGLGFLERLNSSPQIAFRDRNATAFGAQHTGVNMDRDQVSIRSSPVSSLQTHQSRNHSRITSLDRYEGHRVSNRPQTVNSSQVNQQNLTDYGAPHTTNHFGGITIEVTNASDSESLLRNLQLQGIGQRIRRG